MKEFVTIVRCGKELIATLQVWAQDQAASQEAALQYVGNLTQEPGVVVRDLALNSHAETYEEAARLGDSHENNKVHS